MEQQHHEKLLEILERVLDSEDQLAQMATAKNVALKDVRECSQTIAAIVDDYKAILAAVPVAERDSVSRRYGTKVVELQRAADRLPKASRERDVVPAASDDTWTVGPRVSKKTAPQSAETPQAAAPASRYQPLPDGPRVSGEVEAWCGPCKRLTNHRIIAMVGDEIKQVVCDSCDGRHGFRLTPARSKDVPSETEGQTKRRLTTDQRKARKLEEEREALDEELAAASEVRPFAPRARYKAGEIIEHPEHGRGRIENVLRGSILVRFRTGLRPLMTL